ncbi:MAG: phosphoglycerate mutase family protein [Acidobacteria bacterium]|nr:phosphoglycerate mutase family protein [Acidobacteriota bacterium]
MTVARFLLVRHGQSEWNSVGRMQGHADSPLTPEGRRQAQSAARKLKGFDWVTSSDLSRAFDTAVIIARELSIPRLPALTELREVDVGPWQGLTRRDIERQFPGFLDNDMRPPGYEADESVFERVRNALVRLATESTDASLSTGAASRPTGLLVTHSGVIRVMRRVLGYPDQRNHRNLEGCWFTVTTDGTVNVEESVNVLRNATISNTL